MLLSQIRRIPLQLFQSNLLAGTAEFFFYYKQICCDFQEKTRYYINLYGYYFSPDYIYIYPVPLSKDRNLLRKSRPTQGGHALAMPRKFRISLSSGGET